MRGKKIAFLGVTFKPNTDDMRDSCKFKNDTYLCNNGCQVFYCDPTGPKKDFNKLKNCQFVKNINEACQKADLVILHTEWDEFKSLEFNKIVKKKIVNVFDLRNLYDLKQMRNKKIKYFSIGRPQN